MISFKNNKQNWYVSELGKCIYTNKNYNNNNSISFEENVTSFNLNNNIYDKNPMTLQELNKYIGQYNYKILNQRINQIIYFLKKSYHNKLNYDINNNNNCFQLFGIDFIFTKDFVPYLLEINKGPQMLYINSKEKQLKQRLIEDIFDKVGIVKSYKLNYFTKILDN